MGPRRPWALLLVVTLLGWIAVSCEASVDLSWLPGVYDDGDDDGVVPSGPSPDVILGPSARSGLPPRPSPGLLLRGAPSTQQAPGTDVGSAIDARPPPVS